MPDLRWSAVLFSASLFTSCSGTAKAPVVSGISPAARIQQIPSADSQKYADMRDMKGWRNPYLIIRTDGVGVLDVANNEQQVIDPNKLPEILANLPPSAWPYGRVVAVQENIVIGSEEDRAHIRKNRALVAGTLADLHVLINWVPAA